MCVSRACVCEQGMCKEEPNVSTLCMVSNLFPFRLWMKSKLCTSKWPYWLLRVGFGIASGIKLLERTILYCSLVSVFIMMDQNM